MEISNLNNDYLVDVIDIIATSTFDLLQSTEFKSPIWDIHTAGLAFGVWVSICNPDVISLEDIEEMINERVKIRLS